MQRISKAIVKCRIPILVLSFLLLIPSALGFLKTRINYDVLYYLPGDIETMQGQDILLKDFGKGAYALFVAEGVTDPQAARLKAEIEGVDHVAQVIWYDSLLDDSIPQAMLPEKLYDAFHAGDTTLMAIFFDSGTSEDTTLDAVVRIRELAGERCFLSSMSAIVTDTKLLVERELFWYVLIAVLLSALVLAVTMDSWMAPVLFLTNIGLAVVYNMGTNVFKGEISFITMSLAAVLQLGVTMDYSIFLWHSFKEQLEHTPDQEQAMADAISATITSVAGSSLTTMAGFLALCFMTFTLGMDLGVVMAKGVVFGVLTCVTVLPALILSCQKLIQKTSHKPLTVNGERFSQLVLKHSKLFLVGLLILWAPAIYGNNHVQTYYKLDSSLPAYLNSVQANKELDEKFDMSTVHLVLADRNLPMRETKEMLSRMEQVDGVQFALGTDSLIGYNIPKAFLPEDLTGKLASGRWQLMLISTRYPVASDEVNAQIDTLQAILKEYDDTAMLIGEAPCTRDLINITDRDFQMVSIASIGAIFVIIFFVLQSFVLPFLLVLVIELAIFINMAISCYTGVTLPFVASIVIGTIQLGATVDYAILMTTRYKRERLAGQSKEQAAHTALSTSVPSVLTSALGFFAATIGVGLYSDVDLIGSLCVLMSRGALISMAVVLTLLPTLYLLCDGLIMKSFWGSGSKPRKHSKKLSAVTTALH